MKKRVLFISSSIGLGHAPRVNARLHASKHYKFLGNILQFNPKDYTNQEDMKGKLGYGTGPLIICSLGGTSIG